MKTFGHSETKSPHDAMEEVDGGVLPLLFKPEGILIQVVVANRMVSSSMAHMLNKLLLAVSHKNGPPQVVLLHLIENLCGGWRR